MIGRNLIVQLDNLKPSQQIAVPEKGKCVANNQEKLSEILCGYETEGQAFQNRSWSWKATLVVTTKTGAIWSAATGKAHWSCDFPTIQDDTTWCNRRLVRSLKVSTSSTETGSFIDDVTSELDLNNPGTFTSMLLKNPRAERALQGLKRGRGSLLCRIPY